MADKKNDLRMLKMSLDLDSPSDVLTRDQIREIAERNSLELERSMAPAPSNDSSQSNGGR